MAFNIFNSAKTSLVAYFCNFGCAYSDYCIIGVVCCSSSTCCIIYGLGTITDYNIPAVYFYEVNFDSANLVLSI